MFDTIRNNSLSVMTHYQSDLDIDRDAIAEKPGIPFLHWTRATGTLIVFLTPYEQLPGAGVRVPYLFGTADRLHLIDQMRTMSRYYVENSGCLVTQYFDGVKVRVIDPAKAAAIGLAHVARLETAIRAEGKRRAA